MLTALALSVCGELKPVATVDSALEYCSSPRTLSDVAGLRSGGPSLSESAHYPQGFANFICDCYMQDWVTWMDFHLFPPCMLIVKPTSPKTYMLTACKAEGKLPELDMPSDLAGLAGMAPLVPWLNKNQPCLSHWTLDYVLLYCHKLSQVPPFDWKDAQLDEIRNFLLDEAAAGRFVPTSGLTL